jgi:hypothetical protein
MKPSCHRLIPFFQFLCNHLRLPSPELDQILFLLDYFTSFHFSTQLHYSASTLLSSRTLLMTTFARTTRKKTVFTSPLPNNGRLSVVACACIAWMCLPSRCIAVGIHVTNYIYITQICVLIVTVKFSRSSIFGWISMPLQHRRHLVNVMYLPPFPRNSASRNLK